MFLQVVNLKRACKACTDRTQSITKSYYGNRCGAAVAAGAEFPAGFAPEVAARQATIAKTAPCPTRRLTQLAPIRLGRTSTRLFERQR
jgi:hypothetical protein